MSESPAVHVGLDVPPMQRRIELPDMIAYAGATWDWHRLHYDSAYVTALGFERPVIDGQVFGALLAEAVQDWLGADAFVQALDFRFASPAYAGDTVRCSGEVTAVDGGVITLALRVDAADGDGWRPTVTRAHCTVLLRS